MSTIHLKGSSEEREAAADAIHRFIRAFDDHDEKMFYSSMVEKGASFEISGISFDREQLKKLLFDSIGPMDTTHTLSSVRVNVHDDKCTASLTANAVTQHCPPGTGLELSGRKFLVGSIYRADLIKDERDGLWKIKKLLSKIVWREGDDTIVAN